MMRTVWLFVPLLFAVGRARNNDPLSSPETTLSHYIDGLRTGNLAAARNAMLDADNFYLPGPLQIDSFHIVRKDVLDAREAAERPFIPLPVAGDVEMDVRQFEGGQDRMYTYNLRKIKGSWRIYSHSGWGADIESLE